MTTGFVLPYARLTTITCKNGKSYGFCSSSIEIAKNNILYYGDFGADTTTQESSLSLSVDTMEFTVIKNDSIRLLPFSDFNVENGLFQEAKVTIHIEDLVTLNPITPLGTRTQIFNGFVGRVTSYPTAYKFEFRTQSTKMGRLSVDKTSPYCPLEFGGTKCGYNLAANGEVQPNVTVTMPVTASSVEDVFVLQTNHSITAGLTTRYGGGIITFTSGDNLNYSRLITSVNSSGLVQFQGLPPFTINVNDTVSLKAACKKTTAECQLRNNYGNFGGFPGGGNFMKGIDQIVLNGGRTGQKT